MIAWVINQCNASKRIRDKNQLTVEDYGQSSGI